ncbi:helix-turn-helix transcriptional regulator [Streptomyces thermolilacinus]
MNYGRKPSKGPAGAAVAFGRLLKFHRERAGVTLEALGKHTSYSKSQVAMVERGERRPKDHFVERADALLGAQGALKAVAETITASSVPAWWEDYLEEEEKAAGIHTYETGVIPGLLQSPRYAEAVFACHIPAWDEEQAEALLAGRMARQEVYNRKPRPIITYVLEKTALTRPIGGREVLKDCLTHILDIARLPNVTIQVMPEDRETHVGLNGPFVLLETAERKGQLGYVEGQSGRYFISEQPALGDMFMRYSTLRAHALAPELSVNFIEEVAQGL